VLLAALVIVRRIWRGPAPDSPSATTTVKDRSARIDADLAAATD
jgi:hypothetical protein